MRKAETVSRLTELSAYPAYAGGRLEEKSLGTALSFDELGNMGNSWPYSAPNIRRMLP